MAVRMSESDAHGLNQAQIGRKILVLRSPQYTRLLISFPLKLLLVSNFMFEKITHFSMEDN
jgi:hypothetical protein